MRYVVLEKKVGETPLFALQEWKKQNPAYADFPASYAGRLDPMASGTLLVLLGEECKKQEKYTGLDKEYEIEVLLDIGSDTGDALGIVVYEHKETVVGRNTLSQILRAEVGTHKRLYPHFSSKTVNGKPLFLHALEGTLDSITIPTHHEHIYRIQLLDVVEISATELQSRIREYLAQVPKTAEPSKKLGADFRIAQVRQGWHAVFEETANRTFHIVKLRVTCGTGTYMRTLASRIAQALGTQGIALSIHRTHIGRFGFGFWWKRYG